MFAAYFVILNRGKNSKAALQTLHQTHRNITRMFKNKTRSNRSAARRTTLWLVWSIYWI